MAWVRYEEETEAFTERYYDLVLDLQSANPSDYPEVASIAAELLSEIGNYLSQFSPDSTPFDVATVISVYGYMATYDP